MKSELCNDKKQITYAKFFFRPEMYYRLQEFNQKPFELIGTPDENYWKGKRSIEINGVDIAKGGMQDIPSNKRASQTGQVVQLDDDKNQDIEMSLAKRVKVEVAVTT